MTAFFSRREFLERASLLAVGAAGGALAARGVFSTAALAAEGPGPEQRLKELKLELPPLAPATANALVPTVRTGDLLWVSGHTPPKLADGTAFVGKVGRELTLEQGREAARQVALRILAVVRAELGSLDKVVRLVKTLGMVNSAPEFTDQPKVINGFSELLVDVFGPTQGKGTRSAVGMASLPGGVAVEVEALFQVR